MVTHKNLWEIFTSSNCIHGRNRDKTNLKRNGQRYGDGFETIIMDQNEPAL